jgi:hypothetical protein
MGHQAIKDMRDMSWKDEAGHVICMTVVAVVCIAAGAFIFLFVMAAPR